uniref:LIM zinc-binding domain-containing protein n=1 Tax=Eptatretus burgeri TaxID=7764 RepID=A0A8C4WZY3_EPTBU
MLVYCVGVATLCGGCSLPIGDRFLLKALERSWHASCLRCRDCQSPLSEVCVRLCLSVPCMPCRRFGTKCAGCRQGIPPSQAVRKAQERVFHLHCFACSLCGRQLVTGDLFYLLDDARLVCQHDYPGTEGLMGDIKIMCEDDTWW